MTDQVEVSYKTKDENKIFQKKAKSEQCVLEIEDETVNIETTENDHHTSDNTLECHNSKQSCSTTEHDDVDERRLNDEHCDDDKGVPELPLEEYGDIRNSQSGLNYRNNTDEADHRETDGHSESVQAGLENSSNNEDTGSIRSITDVDCDHVYNDDVINAGSRSPPTLIFTSEWYYENPKSSTPSLKSEASDDDSHSRRLSVDTYNAESDTDSELPPQLLDRRSSKWSATILFVASEIQMIIDLAEFSPEEAYLTAPKKVCLLLRSIQTIILPVRVTLRGLGHLTWEHGTL